MHIKIFSSTGGVKVWQNFLSECFISRKASWMNCTSSSKSSGSSLSSTVLFFVLLITPPPRWRPNRALSPCHGPSDSPCWRRYCLVPSLQHPQERISHPTPWPCPCLSSQPPSASAPHTGVLLHKP